MSFLLICLFSSTCFGKYEELKAALHNPSIDDIVTMFMAALNTRNQGQRRQFMQALADSDRPSEDEIRILFKEAVHKVIKTQLDQLMSALPKEQPLMEASVAEPELDRTTEDAIRRHINVARSALKVEAESSDELLFALSAVGYLAGLLELPQTRHLVGMTSQQLHSIESHIIDKIERSKEPYVDLKMNAGDEYQDSMFDPVKDTLEVKEKTVIEADGTRIRTKKILHTQVADR